MSRAPASVVYADDTDPFVDYIVVNHTSTPLTFTPMVAIDAGAYDITGTWQGDPGTTRTLRIPLTDVPVGLHALFLQVEGGTDFELEPEVLITTRAQP